MTPADRRACLCGCGQTFARAKSLPLCKAAAARVHSLYRTQTIGLGPVEKQRAFNAMYGSVERVRALLTDAVTAGA